MDLDSQFDSQFRDRDLTESDRLSAEFDPRLADVWLTVFASEADTASIKQELGWFLRMAYLRGYEDALTEPVKGQLYRRLGVKAPDVVTSKRGGRK